MGGSESVEEPVPGQGGQGGRGQEGAGGSVPVGAGASFPGVPWVEGVGVVHGVAWFLETGEWGG